MARVMRAMRLVTPASVLRRLIGCARGTGIVELAIVAPVLVTVLVGLVDVTQAVAIKYGFTRSATRSVELASSKGAVNGSFDYIRNEAAEASGRPPEAVAVDYWLECNYERQPDAEGVCTAPDLPFRYLKVTISGGYRPLFSWLLPAEIPLNGSAVVRIQ